jgi:pimeloyl-ACP methyl ester carboxylesterase
VKRTNVTIAGCEIELHDSGSGTPLLFLHPGSGFVPADPYVSLLSAQRRLVAPSHPGFGTSALPGWIDSVDDIAHLYLELMDQLDLRKVDVIAGSVGGWIAAEMATKSPERFGKLVMVGPVGVKTGPVNELDIPDIYVLPPSDVPKLMFHDPSKQPGLDSFSDEELTVQARNRETLALIVWEPYMHNPKLPHRLHRVTSPTLFVRGESDGLVSQSYLESYARLIPGARTATIPEAGHSPQLEQPQAFARLILEFLGA